MKKIRVVLDSGADFPSPALVERYNLQLVPHYLVWEDERHLDTPQLNRQWLWSRLQEGQRPPHRLEAPSVAEFAALYQKLYQTTDKIISLHSAAHLSDSFENAKQAAQILQGRCQIAVMDSRTTSVGLGLLGEVAGQVAEATSNLQEAVRMLRGTTERVYSLFYVDNAETLQARGLLSPSHTLLAGLLGVKPFLTLEEGKIVVMEKTRTRLQAVEKLIEFVAEFETFSRLVIVQSQAHANETTRMLQERLVMIYPHMTARQFPIVTYGATLATYLGPQATGVVVLESTA